MEKTLDISCVMCGYACIWALQCLDAQKGQKMKWVCHLCLSLSRMKPRRSNQKQNPQKRVPLLLNGEKHQRSKCVVCQRDTDGLPPLMFTFEYREKSKYNTEKPSVCNSTKALSSDLVAALSLCDLYCCNCLKLTKLSRAKQFEMEKLWLKVLPPVFHDILKRKCQEPISFCTKEQQLQQRLYCETHKLMLPMVAAKHDEEKTVEYVIERIYH
jgi:hypothetical protein